MKEGGLYLTFNKNDIWKIGTITAYPFDWLEASYFYYRPSDLVWGGDGVKGHYLDKGFNVKLSYTPKNDLLPKFALGLDDFAGTGLLTKEYIVATKSFDSFKATLGMGWGKFIGKDGFENPLTFLSESLSSRNKNVSNYGFGGNLNYEKWFRGDATLFGGFEWHIQKFNGLKVKVEYDPMSYKDFSIGVIDSNVDLNLRKKDSDINIGLSYPINKYINIEASFIKGNTLNFSFIFGKIFSSNNIKKKPFKPVIKYQNSVKNSKIDFYEDLISNLNNNRILLQTANIRDKNLQIAVSTSEHRNSIRSASYAASIAQNIAEFHNIDIGAINISHINVGLELNNLTFYEGHINPKKNTPVEVIRYYSKIESGKGKKYNEYEFKPKVSFPAVFSSTSPTLVNHIGNPEKFYYGGIIIQNVSEIQFSRSLLLSSEINYSVADNFRDTISGPGSNMEHVRTDIVQYLKNSDDIYISRLEFDYIWSPAQDLYARASIGLFEEMYGGFGFEILYKPFDNNFTIAFEDFYVQKRDFDQRFKFLDYKTNTGHITFGYLFANSGIEANLSLGRYLAKDDGYTVDLSRRTNSGFKSGFYFTRTNVSKELFGEGSFDKGFYFQIPIDLFSKGYSNNYTNFKLSPLTRDGGAKLIQQNSLRGLIYNSSNTEISRDWDGFLD